MIEEFIDQYAFLSNDYWFSGTTVTHHYEASKTLSLKIGQEILKLGTPTEAREIGRRVLLRPGWDEMQLIVMRNLVEIKFAYPFLRSQILSTGDEELLNNNNYKDKYWGIYQGEGSNYLGRILSYVRQEIQTNFLGPTGSRRKIRLSILNGRRKDDSLEPFIHILHK